MLNLPSLLDIQIKGQVGQCDSETSEEISTLDILLGIINRKVTSDALFALISPQSSYHCLALYHILSFVFCLSSLKCKFHETRVFVSLCYGCSFSSQTTYNT